MKEFFKDVLSMPYTKNGMGDSSHEDAVEELLKKHNLSYKAQPYGINRHPDFEVYYNGSKVWLECKSTKHHTIIHNSSYPKTGTVYILTSKKYNQTTVFRGEDVLPPETKEKFENITSKVKEYAQELLEECGVYEENINPHGFDITFRGCVYQKGGWKKTDFFRHKNRQRFERNVLETTY